MGYRPIQWTERSEEHIARHGVTPEEVEEVVFSRPQWEALGRDDSTLVYGTTDAGRYLLVVLADSVAESEAWYVATARDMTQRERKLFVQKAR
ncbi:hypothetical protein ACFFWE_25010 [Sphaerisporangium melleum]|uniref:hypothetical protein n=1 Tax=Sphaerisporangium melleum TaxID=321316 RepID=UPI00194EE31F|nr:hypothetical protein [Sphaerisporangium melleum]